MRKALGVIAMLCLLSVQSQAADDKKADADKLEGTWESTSFEFGGQKIDVPKGKEIVLTFKSGKFTKKEADKKDEEGTYKFVDEKDEKPPFKVDLTGPKEGKPDEKETMKAIYKVDGDTLKIAFTKPDAERAKAFDGKDVIILNFKKKK